MLPICIIPARGGSERLPGKNIRPLGGKPLIAHAISCALASGLFSDVYVATDSPDIAAAAVAHGAVVPLLLPDRITEATQPSMGACVHLHDFLRHRGEGPWDCLVCLQPTSPLTLPEDIHQALAVMRRGIFEHVVSVTPIDPHYFHWAMLPHGDYVSPYFGEQFNCDRKFLPPVLRPNGAIKIMRNDVLGKQETFLDSALVGFHSMPEERSISIGAEFDWVLAEALYTGGARHAV